jgi:DNA replication protein DnaC
MADSRIKSSGLDKLANMTFQSFNTKHNPQNAKVYRTCRDYAERFQVYRSQENNSIGLVGPNGTGKTHLLAAIANELLRQKVNVIFVYTPDLFDELRDCHENPDARLIDKLATLKSAEAVMFDDMARERLSPWVREQYDKIINYRSVNKLPTCFTTNRDLGDLWAEEKLGGAAMSRLLRMTEGRRFLVEGADYRLRGAV